jgi:hypothetical protein
VSKGPAANFFKIQLAIVSDTSFPNFSIPGALFSKHGGSSDFWNELAPCRKLFSHVFALFNSAVDKNSLLFFVSMFSMSAEMSLKGSFGSSLFGKLSQ